MCSLLLLSFWSADLGIHVLLCYPKTLVSTLHIRFRNPYLQESLSPCPELSYEIHCYGIWVSGQQYETDGEQRDSALWGIGCPHNTQEGKAINSILGTWEWACPDEIKHRNKTETMSGTQKEKGESQVLKAYELLEHLILSSLIKVSGHIRVL